MSVNRVENRRRPRPLGPFWPERPLDRPWPSPTPGLPVTRSNRMLKQILDKLSDIEKRLDKIEKLLSKRPV